MKKRLLCLTLALALGGSQAMTVCASREDDLRQAQAYTSYALNDTYARINALENEKAQIWAAIGEIDQNLMNIMISVTVLENSIAAKEADITKTEEDLTKAEKARDKQYDDMKKRIQLLYEKGGDSAWFQMLMEAEDVSDLLTRAEYTQKLYDHDRECLEKYVKVVEEVEKLGTQYKTEKAELESMHDEYVVQQQELENQKSVLESTSANYEAEISYAQDQAYLYAAILEQQTAEIAQLEAERIAAEQAAQAAAAQAAAEQAAQIAAAEQAAQAAAAEQAAQIAAAEQGEATAGTDAVYGDTTAYGDTAAYGDAAGTDTAVTDTTTDTTYTDYSAAADTTAATTDTTTAQYDEYGNVIVDSSSVATTTPTTTTTTSTGSSSGNSVVDYATQFVGNPYVWGGTSLTNGADCSGFVQSVYNNFGVDLPRTSYDQMTVGTEVSYEDAQPGDLICYGGHIAIYMGDGQIVHAANSEQGIIVSNNAAYDTILSVRRVI